VPRRTIIAVLAVLITVALGGCAAPLRPCPEVVLAAHYKLMSRAELIRYQDRLEDEMVRVGAGGAAPDGVSREDYLGDLRQRMKDVQHEIGLRNIWERKSCWERREMWGPTR